jgi:hypothetical protein
VNRWITALSLVLLIQCGIVAAVFWPQQSTQQQSASQTFAPFPVNAIDELHISDEFDNEAVLVRSGEQWLLPDLENLPADANRVDALLHDLTTQSGIWPIAQSSTARQRFQVADYYYQKRLTLLSSGQELGTLYLGTSPGFRKVHARNAQQDDIYSITFNAFEIPAVNDGWLDTRLLQVRAPLRIDTDLYNLYFENGRWMSATGGTPDEAELNTLISALRDLQVVGVAGEDLQRDLSAVEADLVMTVQSLAGDVTLEIVTHAGEHFIQSSEFPLFFTCAKDCERLTGVDAGRIAGEEEEGDDDRPATEDDPSTAGG